MSAHSDKSYKKRSEDFPKIARVYDTEKNESIWIVRTVDGKRRKLSKKMIENHNMVTSETIWTVERIGCKFRYKVGEEKRRVYWKGFKDPTIESGDFKTQISYSSDDDE